MIGYDDPFGHDESGAKNFALEKLCALVDAAERIATAVEKLGHPPVIDNGLCNLSLGIGPLGLPHLCVKARLHTGDHSVMLGDLGRST